jgi:myo-inositol-1(or 4)-monophosphatase
VNRSRAIDDAPSYLLELLELARELAQRAGAVHRDALAKPLHIQTKSTPSDYVSQVDREAERVIFEALVDARPDDGLLGEEGGGRAGSSGVRWLIDPLDGTMNYVYGYPAFSVSIGVEVEGRPQVGVVHESLTNRTYMALAGLGACCDGEPLAVREQPDLARALLATGLSYDAAHRAWEGGVLAQVIARVSDIRRSGSAALDLCHVAAGHVDGYFEFDLAPWDYAAGRVIAREAGAIVRTLLSPHGGTGVVAAHPALLSQLVALLESAGGIVGPAA